MECAAPVAAGLCKQYASINFTIALFMANPVLNPATIIFMRFVLSWKFAIYMTIKGLILVFVIATWANKFENKKEDHEVLES